MILLAGLMLMHTPLARGEEGPVLVVAVGEPQSPSYRVGLGVASLLRTIETADRTEVQAEVWESLRPNARVIALLEDAQFAVVPADDEMLADPRAQENIRAAVRLADGNQILVNAELDDVLVYEITRMIIENGELSPLPYEKIADVSSRPPFKGPIVGLHPGAMRYYREHGQELSKPGELEIAGEEQSPTNHPAEPSAPSRHPPDLRSLNAATSLIADALRTTRLDAISRHEEGVFVIDVEKRIFATSLGGSPTSLEPGVEILLYTAESEMIDDSKGGIRFFADGSSTGGQIDLIYSGDNAAISVDWRHGVVTVTSDGPSASR